jgi:hypothetical protein
MVRIVNIKYVVIAGNSTLITNDLKLNKINNPLSCVRINSKQQVSTLKLITLSQGKVEKATVMKPDLTWQCFFRLFLNCQEFFF